MGIHQHHKDVAALHHDPSYRYGNNLDVFGAPFDSATSSKSDAILDKQHTNVAEVVR